jgi:hypothetical protein
MHYVLHEIESGEFIAASIEPFTAADLKIGLAVEFFDSEMPLQDDYYWNPKYLMWRKN